MAGLTISEKISSKLRTRKVGKKSMRWKKKRRGVGTKNYLAAVQGQTHELLLSSLLQQSRSSGNISTHYLDLVLAIAPLL